jgi:hypothetical protein
MQCGARTQPPWLDILLPWMSRPVARMSNDIMPDLAIRFKKRFVYVSVPQQTDFSGILSECLDIFLI